MRREGEVNKVEGNSSSSKHLIVKYKIPPNGAENCQETLLSQSNDSSQNCRSKSADEDAIYPADLETHKNGHLPSSHQMEEQKSQKSQSFSQWTRSQKTLFSILLTIIALLTIGLITLFIMYLHKSVSNNEKTLLEENISKIFGEKSVCTSVQCVQSAAEILNSMDKKIDPCEDFYGFACNGWISNNPIPKGQATWSLTKERAEENLFLLRQLLENPINKNSSKSEQKSQVFYRSCMDSGHHAEKNGGKLLKEIIRKVGGWNLTKSQDSDTYNTSSFDLQTKLILVQQFTTDALFSWNIGEGMNNTKKHELYIHQGGLTLPSREMYNDPTSVNAYRRFIHQIVELLNVDTREKTSENIEKTTDNIENSLENSEFGRKIFADNESNAESEEESSRISTNFGKSEIDDLINFEKILAKISSRDDSVAGTFISLEDADQLLPLTPNWISWTSFFNKVSSNILSEDNFVSPKIRVWIQYSYISSLRDTLALHYQKAALNVTSDPKNDKLFQEFFQRQKMPPIKIIQDDKTRFFNTLNNYLTWRAILPFISYMPRKFQKAEKDFWKHLQGVKGSEERWRTCVIRTTTTLGFALSPSFVRNSFSESSRQLALQIIESIKTAFKARLDELDWIGDEATRISIKTKLENGIQLFGYPDYIFNHTQLDQFYDEFGVAETEYFENQVRFYRFALKRNLELLHRNVERSYWPLTFPPSTVNAFYLYSRNLMLFPAGVLQPPFFSENQPMSLNFGHIGSFMGHELLHGFDNTGRLYNPEGKKEPWWPQSVINSFNEKTDCFIQQYSKSFGGGTVDGRQTLSENIADNGGLLSAYRGYQTWLKDHSSSATILTLPGMESISDVQLFFIGFARAHCSSSKRKAMGLRLLVDSHSPNHMRVNNAVSNFPEFARAWKCRKNSPLNLPSSQRCSLW